MAHSRNKGRAFEQRIARDLRGWLGDEWAVERNLNDDQSGKGGKRSGDLLVHSGPFDFPFKVECKFNDKLKPSHFWMQGGSKLLQDFWEQADRQALSANKLPLLIANPAGPTMPVVCVVDLPAHSVLSSGAVNHDFGVELEMTLCGRRVVVSCWSDWLTMPPSALRELLPMEMGDPEMMATEDAWFPVDGDQ